MGSSFNEKVFRLIYLIKLRGLETKVNYLVDWNGRKKVKNHWSKQQIPGRTLLQKASFGKNCVAPTLFASAIIPYA